MVRIRPTNLELIKKLTALGKPYFTTADLERVLGLRKESLYVTLNRLTNAGVLTRLKKNVYLVFAKDTDPEKIANELCYPAYLSFEKVLADEGILAEAPLGLTFATRRSSRKMVLADTEVEYSHLKKNLFFGYEVREGKNVALPEKALLDTLYLVSKGKRQLELGGLNLDKIDRARFLEFSQQFPVSMAALAKKVARRLKKQSEGK